MSTTNRNATLIAGYFDGCLSPTELTELESLLAAGTVSGEDFARAARFEDLLERHFADETAIVGATVNAQPAIFLERVMDDSPAMVTLPRRAFVDWAPAVVAMLVVAAGLLVYYFSRASHSEHQVVSGAVLVDGVAASHIPAGARVEVTGLEMARVRLSDGSEADLEPATEAIFHSAGAEQQVELSSGGGRFHARPQGQVIYVNTPGGSLLARDTDFTVKLRESPTEELGPMNGNLLMALTIAVMAGQVQVDSPDQKITVKAGEQREIAYEKKPAFTGKVVAVATDGKSITLEGRPPKPGLDPAQATIEITEQTKLEFYGMTKNGAKPTIGYPATAWLEKAAPEKATLIVFGSKEPGVSGVVIKVADDGKSMEIQIHQKLGEPIRRSVTLDDATRFAFAGPDPTGSRRPQVEDFVHVWLGEGDKVATEIKFGPPKNKLPAKPADGTPPGEKSVKPKPAADKPTVEKPAPEKPLPEKPEDAKPKDAKPTETKPKKEPPKDEPAPLTKVKKPDPNEKPATAMKKPEKENPAANKNKPVAEIKRRTTTRDAAPVAAAIDRLAAEALAKANTPASPLADDAEFVRRAALDIGGRIPQLGETMSFFADDSPNKRREWIEYFVASRDFSDHFGRIWKRLIAPPDLTSTKQGNDRFTPWLADQFAANRPWNETVTELLTGEIDINQDPRGTFFKFNGEGSTPKPNLLAASTGRLFLGVQIGCAECHNHPFSDWKQEDFWSLAAFYGRVRTRAKGDFTLTEDPKDAQPAPATASITIPEGSGKGAGKVVPARFLGGPPPSDASAPLRPQLAAWLTARDNPYFARAMVNRLWAHFFGRGLVHPVDDQRDGNEPSHPQILQLLAEEFVASDFDIQHIVRCICLSQAYQRTSRPTAENEQDVKLLSHHMARAMTPDMLYDSLHVALNANPATVVASAGKPAGKFGGSVVLESRDSFSRFFGRTSEDLASDQFGYGIPQLLRMLNAREFNAGAPFLPQLVSRETEVDKRLETLYLIALSRRPSSDEVQRMRSLLGSDQESAEAYAGALWVLLNSSEFVVNH